MMMCQNPKGKKATRSTARSIDVRAPHLANGGDRESKSRESSLDVRRRRIGRKTPQDRFGDMTNNRVMREKLEVIGRRSTEDHLILIQ